MNFQAADGHWKPIDRTLKATPSGALRPAALDGDLVLPTTLTSPVELAHDGRALSVRLVGASGARRTTGDSATFKEALSDIDVTYASRSYGVKETLVLKSRDAPERFAYELLGDSRLQASIEGGSVVLRDVAGAARFRIDAPLAWDSADAAAYTNELDLSIVKKAPGRWVLTLKPDADWLRDPARVYPVSLDPDYYWLDSDTTRLHGAADCYVAGGSQAGQSYCSSSTLQVGYYLRPYKSLFKFDVASAIPGNAIVSDAAFQAYQPGTGTRPSGNMRLRTLTSDWNNTATWDVRKSGVLWGTKSGDVSSDPALVGPPAAVADAGAWYSWTAPLAAVRGWVNGTLPNYGLQLAAEPDAPANVSYVFSSTESASAQWPSLDVTWTLPDAVAPPAPANVRAEAAEPGDRTVDILFDEGDDVAQAGSIPSGVEFSEFQVAKRGGPFTSWTRIDESSFLVTDVDEGNQLIVNVRTRDVAGNISAVTQRTLTTFYDGATPMLDEASDGFARQFNVPASEARSWLITQEQTLEAVSDLAGTAGDDSVAGTWFDNATRVAHIQMLANADRVAVTAAVAARGLSASVVIDSANYTREHLETKAADLNASLADLLASGQVLVMIKRNLTGLSLFVHSALRPNANARLTQAARATGVAVFVKDVSDKPELAATPQAASCSVMKEEQPSPPFLANQDELIFGAVACAGEVRGGVRISRPRGSGNQVLACTAAVPAVSQDGKTPYMLTAGHCISESSGDPDDWDDDVWTQRRGPVLGTSAKRIYEKGGTDAGAIKLTQLGDEKLRPIVYRGQSNQKARLSGITPIPDPFTYDTYNKVKEYAPGRVVCMLGSVTHRLFNSSAAATDQAFGDRCAPILDVYTGTPGKLIGDDPKAPVHRILINSCRGRDGDSGAPIVTTNNKVAGIYSGIVAEVGNTAAANTVLFDQSLVHNFTGVTLAKCGTGGQRGLLVGSPITEVEKRLKVKVLRRSWRRPKALATPAAVEGNIRISMVNATPTKQVNLFVWDAQGNWDSVYPAGFPGAGMPGMRVKKLASGAPATEPLEVREVSPVGRGLGIGLCYSYGSGAASVELEVTDPAGDTRTLSFELGSPGQTVLAGSTPAAAALAPPSTGQFAAQAWCPAPGSPAQPNESCNAATGPAYGSNFLVARPQGEGEALEMRDSNGLNPTPVTNDGRGAWESVWSPDRRRVISGQSTGWWATLPGVNGTHVSLRTGWNDSADGYVSCSPDGTMLARVVQGPDPAQGGPIEILNLVTGNIVRHSNVVAVGGVSWSPNGAKLAFEDASVLKVMNVDGSGLVTVSSAPAGLDWSPRWAPDSQHLVFLHYGPASIETQSYMAIQSVTTGLCRRLTAPVLLETHGIDISPSGDSIMWSGAGIGGTSLASARGVFTLNLSTLAQSQVLSNVSGGPFHLVSWGGTLTPNPNWVAPQGLGSCS